MKTGFQCIGCMVNAASNFIKLCVKDEEKRINLFREVLKRLSEENFQQSPVEISHRTNQYLLEQTGMQDPYLAEKRERNQRAAERQERIWGQINSQPDNLLAAVKIAAAGNVMDVIAGGEDLLEPALVRVFEKGFSADDYSIFEQYLAGAENILYLADNAGEIFLDKLLIEILNHSGKNVTVAVRGAPAVDDALYEDYLSAGLEEISKVVTTGTGHQGCVLSEASPDFIKAFEYADLIISKGMGNYESLNELKDERIFFLLTAKCSRVAGLIGVNVGDFCFFHGVKR